MGTLASFSVFGNPRRRLRKPREFQVNKRRWDTASGDHRRIGKGSHVHSTIPPVVVRTRQPAQRVRHGRRAS
jgi:hypothetical protein